MVFSSITFLFYFLPIVLLCYFVLFKKHKNTVLLIASLFFYFYGEPKYILVLLFSCLINYVSGKLIEKMAKYRTLILVVDLVISFGLLFYFKYFGFLVANLNTVFSLEMVIPNIVMPIGISFFTFQATSYTIDIYRGEVKSAKNFWTFTTYLSLFPQLVAGPIVRYETVQNELEQRKNSKVTFAAGVKRFTIGLAKKVLLANVLGELVTILAEGTDASILSYWIEAIAITLQLYFDFSGYSDMAIGLGLLFGFHFLENFNYPLIAKSITDFWRRWHISLSSWFKDYVYIPLGGNRKGIIRQCINILIVWCLTGLWHGASWNFVLWGLYFGVLLIIEKTLLKRVLKLHPHLARIYTFILIVISFVIFHFDDYHELIQFLKGMFGLLSIPLVSQETIYYLRSYGVVLFISLFAISPLGKQLVNSLAQKPRFKRIIDVLEVSYYFVLLFISVSFLVDDTYNPFLYFRF